jgi:DNA-directed RNA polymerase subunit RPC12/RpoP
MMSKVIDFPVSNAMDLTLIKALAYGNYDLIKASGSAICLQCSHRPLFSEITGWEHDDEGHVTAECPSCGSPVIVPEFTIDLLDKTAKQLGITTMKVPSSVSNVDLFIYNELNQSIDRAERQYDVDISLETILCMTRRLAVRGFPLDEIIEEARMAYQKQCAFGVTHERPM